MFTKNVLEAALNEELTEHLGHTDLFDLVSVGTPYGKLGIAACANALRQVMERWQKVVDDEIDISPAFPRSSQARCSQSP